MLRFSSLEYPVVPVGVGEPECAVTLLLHAQQLPARSARSEDAAAGCGAAGAEQELHSFEQHGPVLVVKALLEQIEIVEKHEGGAALGVDREPGDGIPG
jgi:hypothetical protein